MTSNNRLTKAAPLVKWFDSPGQAIREVAAGLCHAGVVRGFMDRAECDRQADAILHCGYEPRTDGIPGGTLGPSLFQHPDDPIKYFYKSALFSSRIQEVLGTTHPPHLLQAIEQFEALRSPRYGFRVRPVVYRGLPAAYNRALIFSSSSPVLVAIHEDVANVRALKTHSLEIADIEIVLAHNLYLRNQPGEGSLYMYGRRYSEQEKKTLDQRLGGKSKIAKDGYNYPLSEFVNSPSTILDVEPGDYVVFRADYPHQVANKATYTDGWRVSWNGFFTPRVPIVASDSIDLLYWT